MSKRIELIWRKQHIHVQHHHLQVVLEDVRENPVTELVERVIRIPDGVPSATSALWGPVCGDRPVLEREVRYLRRGTRTWPSRVCNRAERPAQWLFYAARPAREEGCIFVITCFGMVSQTARSMKEPQDPTLNPKEKETSEAFWAKHALALDWFASRLGVT